MIQGYENFSYVGYTQEEESQLPTLYFEEGHYTQQHNDPSNIGWHPIQKGIICTRINVNANAVKLIMSIQLEETEREENFAERILSGLYTDEQNGTLCEVFYDKKDNYNGIHVSRSFLVKTIHNNFNPEFNSDYAKDILRNGDFAANE
jgi:hypothetical protein